MGDNQALVAYLQKATGYALTGSPSEQVLFFFYGNGNNGKSTFLGTILRIVGDYGLQAGSELLLQKQFSSNSYEQADLFGKRFVATIETEEGRRMAESLMKQLTGGDRLRARQPYQRNFEFDQTWKIFLAANNKPAISSSSVATWRRIKLVPFTVTIPKRERDPELGDKLRTEWPGILAWPYAAAWTGKSTAWTTPPK
jgi:putative DNA primase/helicase